MRWVRTSVHARTQSAHLRLPQLGILHVLTELATPVRFHATATRLRRFPPRAQDRQQQHREKNRQQPKRRRPNADRMLGQDRKPSVHEFNVHPIDQQRSLPQLDQRTESPLARAPAAPRVSRRQNTSSKPTRIRKKFGLVCQKS